MSSSSLKIVNKINHTNTKITMITITNIKRIKIIMRIGNMILMMEFSLMIFWWWRMKRIKINNSNSMDINKISINHNNNRATS